jgi:naphthoate synthase
MTYSDIIVETDRGTTWITIDRESAGNKFRQQTALELADALRAFRADRDARVAVLTGAGEKFFCIGGEHPPIDVHDYSVMLPIVDVYELIDSVPKPVIAAVNGFAVGGGNVLHNVCDLTIAAEHAVFRQVGPLVGSFDAGYGSWYLEDTIGRKRAKEMWYLNRKYTAHQAMQMGLVNEVVPSADLRARVAEIAQELQKRGPGALAGMKSAFSARHTGIVGQARVAHDLMLNRYLTSREARALQESFNGRVDADPSEFFR